MPPQTQTQPRTHKVKSGDTTSQIARNFGVGVSDISGFRSGDPNKIFPGEVLTIGSTASPAPNTINAANLNNATPFQTPPEIPKTAHAALIESTNAAITDLQKDVDKDLKRAERVFDKLGDQGERRAEMLEDEGVREKEAEYKRITNQINAKDLAHRRKIEKIRNENPTGQLSSGQTIAIEKAEREWASERADLSIAAAFARDDFLTAEAIVNDKIEAETEDLRTELESIQFFLQRNEARLSSEQKTILDQQINQIDREIKEKSDLTSNIGQLQLEAAKNGAPSNVIVSIGKAQDIQGAIVAASQYIGGGQDGGGGGSSETIAITAEDRRTLTGAGFTSTDISDLQRAVRDFGVEAVLETLDSESKKAAVRKVYNVAEPEFELTREAVAQIFGVEDTTDKKGGFLGFGAKSGRDTIDEVMAFVERHRSFGMKDDKIRDLILKQAQ